MKSALKYGLTVVVVALAEVSCADQSVPSCSDSSVQKTVLSRAASDGNVTAMLRFIDFTLVDTRTDGTRRDGGYTCSALMHMEIKPNLSRAELDELARTTNGHEIQKSFTTPTRIRYEVLQADNGNVVVQVH